MLAVRKVSLKFNMSIFHWCEHVKSIYEYNPLQAAGGRGMPEEVQRYQSRTQA